MTNEQKAVEYALKLANSSYRFVEQEPIMELFVQACPEDGSRTIPYRALKVLADEATRLRANQQPSIASPDS